MSNWPTLSGVHVAMSGPVTTRYGSDEWCVAYESMLDGMRNLERAIEYHHAHWYAIKDWHWPSMFAHPHKVAEDKLTHATCLRRLWLLRATAYERLDIGLADGHRARADSFLTSMRLWRRRVAYGPRADQI